MGNEHSRPEFPDGRSRSLSPLPRDDQLSPDDDDIPPVPSTMPPAIAAEIHGSASPGSPASLAWRRRHRRGRGIPPGSVADQSRSPSPIIHPQHASQPLPFSAQPPSPSQDGWPATQPKPTKKKKDRSSKKRRKSDRDELEANSTVVENTRKRSRRSAAPPPNIVEGPTVPLHESHEAWREEGLEKAEPEEDGEFEESTLGKEEGRELMLDDIPEGSASNDHGRAQESGDDVAPSTTPQRKRDRRSSDSKSRKKRPLSRSSMASDGGFGDSAPANDDDAVDDSNSSAGQEKAEAEEDLPMSRPPFPGAHTFKGVVSGLNDSMSPFPGADAFATAASVSHEPEPTVVSPQASPDLGSPELDHQPVKAPSEPEGVNDLDHPLAYDVDDYSLPRRDSTPSDASEPILSNAHDLSDPDDRPTSRRSQSQATDEDTGGEEEPGNVKQEALDAEDESSEAEEEPNGTDRGSSVTKEKHVDAENEIQENEVQENEVPDEQQQQPPALLSHHPTPIRASRSNYSARRKAKAPVFERQERREEEEENAHAFEELPADEIVSPPRPRRQTRSSQSAAASSTQQTAPQAKAKAKGRKSRRPNSENDNEDGQASQRSQYRSGPLSSAEQNQIISAVEQFRENEGLTQEALNQMIHENPQASKHPLVGQFWETIQDACPSRPRKKLISWCRLRFHNFAARGTWTPEQDEELADLVERHGKKWSLIAGMINRHQKDVRDRWRNYLVCRGTAKTDVWSESEEERFRDLVEQSIEKIRKNMKRGSNQSPEKLINWLDISEAMGYTRSRLQCMEKWKRIRAAEPLPDQIPTVLPPGSSWRLDKARLDIQRITSDDKYNLMRAVREQNVRSDSKIEWKSIVDDLFGGKYERRALLVTWGRLRKAVPGWERMTTVDCAQYLCDMYEREGGFGDAERAGDRDGDNDGEPSASPKRRHKKSSKSHREKRKKQDKANAAPSNDSSEEQEDEHGVPEEVAVENLENPVASNEHPKSTSEQRHRSKRASSPELGTASSQASLSEEADDVRSIGLQNRARKTEVLRNQDETAQPDSDERMEDSRPSSRGSEKPASSKKRPRGSSSGEEVGTPKRKKSKSSKDSASQNGVNGLKASRVNSEREGLNGTRSMSVISSDMDDMEDIPAKLPGQKRSSQ